MTRIFYDTLFSLIQFILDILAWPCYLICIIFVDLYHLIVPDKTIKPSHVLITGATSGIGEALADQYSKSVNTLILLGRNMSKLENLKKRLEGNHATIYIHSVDVTDRESMKEIISQYSNIDLVIANAGISQGICKIDYNKDIIEQTTYQLFDTNVYGVFNTVIPVIKSMKSQGHGQLCIISSVAGNGSDFTYPFYASTKTAILTWAEGLEAMLEHYNIHVSIAMPGPVQTKILCCGDNIPPVAITPEECAESIINGIEHCDLHIITHPPIYIGCWLMQHNCNFVIKKYILTIASFIRTYCCKNQKFDGEIAFLEEKLMNESNKEKEE